MYNKQGITVHQIETNPDDLEEIIYECQDDTSPNIMEYF